MEVTAALAQIPCTYLVLRADYGYQGAAVSRVLVNVVATLGLASFVGRSGRSKSVWQVDRNEAPVRMWPFLQLAASSTFATCIDWWAQECMVIWSGYLPQPAIKLAAQSILFQLAVVFYMVSAGAKNAVAMRVGNLIGAGNPEKVPQCLLVGLVAIILQVAIVVGVGVLVRDGFIGMFTRNGDIAAEVAKVWPCMLAVCVPFGISFVLFGVLAGAGRQVIVACTFCIACIGGLSIGTHLCFVEEMGLEGLWLGNFSFFVIASLILYTIVLRFDWHAMGSLTCDYRALEGQQSHSVPPSLHHDFTRTITPL
eukprot:TRINITY_DN33647_c0_g1_i4.p1 TRINITY_DN33647_c0_g1~~TRINITY_DN33647_c0_g1_i4.p1  ORF type:complete len:310 (-),score=3.05 TRINITY_DN33647_c0_g1_i4:449-1378(-)